MFNNRKLMLIVAGVIVAALVGVLILTTSPSSDPGPTPTPTQDPGPQYSGTDSLIQQGATTGHIESLKFAIYKFKPDAKTIKITNAEHAHSIAPDGAAIDFIVFNVTIDQASYKGNLLYHGLDGAQFVLKEPKTNTLVYDSGVVKVKTKE